MVKKSSLPIISFADPLSFESWLDDHCDTSPGIRLQIAKKNSGVVTISYNEALEVALCYGWVDSQKEAYDEKTWLQRFTPRGAKSIWSKVNKDKAEQLIANGRMKTSGYKAIEEARKNGNWDKAYESQSIASLPEDFAIELERNAEAKAFYDTLDRQNKYAILFRIHNAKKQETRDKRIRQFIQMLEKGQKIHPSSGTR
ncbi:YdeI/OmpD-associated family protein [Paenibacillus doosanensis]|uniref:YdeI/OmpD-associated family protein n=1 Tax=Paenibacillus doosanensis TaxID=1229154 RepID=UPI00217F96A3|nr:YdeI/OmpD-associated family protein [Paenibacillus doosanensis]MCS7462680.1 YdeI/OmpD-associated family protein [Paenibacillus doosanensis]